MDNILKVVAEKKLKIWRKKNKKYFLALQVVIQKTIQNLTCIKKKIDM